MKSHRYKLNFPVITVANSCSDYCYETTLFTRNKAWEFVWLYMHVFKTV